MVVIVVFFYYLWYNITMSEARPIQNRELLFSRDQRREMSKDINPLIDSALAARGYTEQSTSSERIHLDGSGVIPSRAYLSMFGNTPFDGLSVHSIYSVYSNERHLSRSTVELRKIGGFSVSRLVSIGDRFYTRTVKTPAPHNKVPHTRISEAAALDILQDIRAHTMLGYSSADAPRPAFEVIRELEGLHTYRSVEQRAHYEFDVGPEYGDIQMNVGKSFAVQANKDTGRMRRTTPKRFFELIAEQPLTEGPAFLGVHYSSGRGDASIKLSADIQDSSYSGEEVSAYYNGMVRKLQEEDTSGLQQGVVRNLKKIIHPDSEVQRLG